MPGTLELRITLLDTWEENTLHLPATALVSDLTRAVLAHAKIPRSAADYVVKYKGAELEEGSRTLADAGLASNSALLVMRRRRAPVK
ncbi:MAG TPA: hypothetical protein VGP61_08420 [Gemmatimonadales bacterium]|jgi:hypothetical protein|nr:hypothetical protein [Gemmatimonadales bacterium]